MAEICCGVVSESEATAGTYEPSLRGARARRVEIRKFKFSAGGNPGESTPDSGSWKRQKLDESSSSSSSYRATVSSTTERRAEGESSAAMPRVCEDAGDGEESRVDEKRGSSVASGSGAADECPMYGLTSVCGLRREMEDAVSVEHLFCRNGPEENPHGLHFFGVFDGHGCSHVAMRCKDSLHALVAEELGKREGSWEEAMKRSFLEMDQQVAECSNAGTSRGSCRCELQPPHCDLVGSTAVVAIISPREIVVANCGDSRAVLCRGGNAIPLSVDHKPDRPDELHRIQAGGGRVIYWDGPRVLGVLAMSRAIGDSYLKPHVSSVPEVTVTERSEEDVCLILASDGLWDVVSNETACNVARMCLSGGRPRGGGDGRSGSDKACGDAAMLLTKLALARQTTDNVSVVVVDLRRNI